MEEVTKQHHRSHLDDQLGAWLQQAEREQRRPAVLVIAADSITWINRRWGRAAGDSALRKLARRVAASLEPDDTFARYEGNRSGSSAGPRRPSRRWPWRNTSWAVSRMRRSSSRAVGTRLS